MVVESEDVLAEWHCATIDFTHAGFIGDAVAKYRNRLLMGLMMALGAFWGVAGTGLLPPHVYEERDQGRNPTSVALDHANLMEIDEHFLLDPTLAPDAKQNYYLVRVTTLG
eukprot:449244-Amphidinium_carterae.1